MYIEVGAVEVSTDELPEIEFYYYRSEVTDKIVYQREGTVKISPDDSEKMYLMPKRLAFLTVKRYTFLRCHLVSIDAWGITYRFEDYEENK